MVIATHQLNTGKQQELGALVAHELFERDRRRFGRIAVRGLYCGFVELDGIVGSYYSKALALQIARSLPEVTDVVDLIRVAPPVSSGHSTLFRLAASSARGRVL